MFRTVRSLAPATAGFALPPLMLLAMAGLGAACDGDALDCPQPGSPGCAQGDGGGSQDTAGDGASDTGGSDRPGDGVPTDTAGGDAGPAIPGELLILFDRSGSMSSCSIGGTTREAIAVDEVADALRSHSSLATGLLVFPDTLTTCEASAACDPGRIVVTPGTGSAEKTADWLEGMPKTCGGSPTGLSLEVAVDFAEGSWKTTKPRYALLLSDGQPNCADGDDGKGMMCKPEGTTACTNPTRAFAALDALRGAGVKTFVLLFDGASDPMCASASSADPDTFAEFATRGGAGALRRATSRVTLAAHLDTIFCAVAGCKPPGG